MIYKLINWDRLKLSIVPLMHDLKIGFRHKLTRLRLTQLKMIPIFSVNHTH